ncbi:MAG: tol-pal system protein YbgF, partial [Rhodospirillaceae bacterium]|nr:tol-pal system protein YbgF [Rhodospirillaceae bacterium]
RMFGGARLEFTDPIRVGDAVTRTSELIKLEEKETRSGPLVRAVLRRTISTPRGPATVPPQPPLRALPAPPAAPASQSAAVAPAAANPASILPAGPPKAQYDYALSLMLQKQDFAKAETALAAFIEQNPKDGLAGNAHYWLGETYYVRKSYQEAAFAFAESFQKFPKGNKAPDSLLKLGMSLDRLEKRREACTAYSRLLSSYPNAGARLKARVKREQSRAKCR